MLFHSLILGFLISISTSYWNRIDFKNTLISHFLDILLLSSIIFFSLEYFKENILVLLILFVFLTLYLHFFRIKLFLIFSKNKKQLNIEKDYNDNFNEKVNIFTSNICRKYEYFILEDNIYINEKLLSLNSKTLSNLIHFFKIVQPKKSIKYLSFSIIPFCLFYLGTLNNDYKNYFFILGGISISLLQVYNKYFLSIFKIQKLSDDNDKEFLSPSLIKFKQLLDSEKNNLVYSMEIQKAINEISKV